jgi:hypothetical protein
MQGSSLSLWMNLGGRVLVCKHGTCKCTSDELRACAGCLCDVSFVLSRSVFVSRVMPETRSVASGGHDGRRVWASHAQPEAHQDIIFPHATTFTKVRQYQ